MVTRSCCKSSISGPNNVSSDVGLPVLLLSGAPSASPNDLTTGGSFDWPKSVDCKQTINKGRHSQANMQERKKYSCSAKTELTFIAKTIAAKNEQNFSKARQNTQKYSWCQKLYTQFTRGSSGKLCNAYDVSSEKWMQNKLRTTWRFKNKTADEPICTCTCQRVRNALKSA